MLLQETQKQEYPVQKEFEQHKLQIKSTIKRLIVESKKSEAKALLESEILLN